MFSSDTNRVNRRMRNGHPFRSFSLAGRGTVTAALTAVEMDALRQRGEAVKSRVALSTIIGQDVALTTAGREQLGLCPFHHDGKLGSFTVNDTKGIYHCFACGAGGDHFTYLKERKSLAFVPALRLLESDAGIDFRDAQSRAEFDRAAERRKREALADAEKRSDSARAIWMWAAPMKNTPAEDYLGGRGIDFASLGRFPGAIRYRHDCWNTQLQRKIPAMLTAMTTLDGRHVATHRTYLEYRRGRWTKAAVDKPKMILGDFRGAHIALWKGDSGRKKLAQVPAGTPIAVSEGIEDGLTMALARPELRVIAVASLDNLGALALPDQVQELIWIAQHDKPGSAADRQLEKHIGTHQTGGRTVRCLWPRPGFKDFNDQLRGVRMEDA